MFSQRFQRRVAITDHARRRMEERLVDEALLLDLIEGGTVRYKNEEHLWLFKAYDGRDDNLICVAAVLSGALVVKTVMHHFTWEGEP